MRLSIKYQQKLEKKHPINELDIGVLASRKHMVSKDLCQSIQNYTSCCVEATFLYHVSSPNTL
jgi:hypothetical protein